jgi:hypothetical protein
MLRVKERCRQHNLYVLRSHSRVIRASTMELHKLMESTNSLFRRRGQAVDVDVDDVTLPEWLTGSPAKVI